jgi:hypothetical protein
VPLRGLVRREINATFSGYGNFMTGWRRSLDTVEPAFNLPAGAPTRPKKYSIARELNRVSQNRAHSAKRGLMTTNIQLLICRNAHLDPQ